MFALLLVCFTWFGCSEKVIVTLSCKILHYVSSSASTNASKSRPSPDKNFALKRVCRFISRLMLAHRFGAFRRPAALGLLLRIARPPLGSRFLPKQVCKVQQRTAYGGSITYKRIPFQQSGRRAGIRHALCATLFPLTYVLSRAQRRCSMHSAACWEEALNHFCHRQFRFRNSYRILVALNLYRRVLSAFFSFTNGVPTREQIPHT